MSSQEHKMKIWNLIKDMKIGMLATRHDNDLRARPMYLVQDDYDGTLWFFTDLDAEKVFELEEDNDVCVSFADPHEHIYVSMTGVGRVIRDTTLIESLWNPFVAEWFPQGKDSPNVGLLEIKVTKGEHWDMDTSRMVSAYRQTQGAAGEVPTQGEHEKFGTTQ
ncbi:general stress protein 26 [Halomonas fontilapidosi]|uniref:General stress protein 26 n=1 Tax=Halomonas fontilapidosi TaxID=616675 RepID=A0A7W5DJS2_9GAMM|nr:pyridoxamine 5'-phosphate oxidase family protein [Halomonas fontilapidosi]MBB3183744.1 general stress protein 26 [Halomonas fontilapidosi]